MKERDELVAAASEIRALGAIVTRVARRDLEERLSRRGAGVGAVEHGVLRQLGEGDRTLAYVSRAMTISPSTLVPVIDGLEDKGLLRRNKDPEDRRRSPLSLTGKGRELLARIPPMDGGSTLVESLARMSEEERQQLRTLLRSFVDGLAKDGTLAAELQPLRDASGGADARPPSPDPGRARDRGNRKGTP